MGTRLQWAIYFVSFYSLQADPIISINFWSDVVAIFISNQVEMFALCAEQSEEILEELIHIQRDLFAKLGLHFR